MPERRHAVQVVLDNEAVQALAGVKHPKHRVLLAHAQAVVASRKRGGRARLVVATSVRVEAGWDRTQSASAMINRLRVLDHVLDAAVANRAAGVCRRTGVSVVDAHIGVAVIDLASGHPESTAAPAPVPVVVLTSDPADVLAASVPAVPRIVRI